MKLEIKEIDGLPVTGNLAGPGLISVMLEEFCSSQWNLVHLQQLSSLLLTLKSMYYT